MAQKDEVVVLEVKTIDAVKNVQDLQTNISLLKAKLKDLNIGSAEYQATLGELQVNQNALKNAMHATTATMDQVKDAALGQGKSYNALVTEMAKLKQELRTIDVSTEEGMESFKNMAERINDVNDKLKELDALQGNFQRNVGNYPKTVELGNKTMSKFGDILGGLDKILPNFPSSLGKMRQGMDDINKAGKTLAINPVVALLFLLAPLLTKITEKVKENDSAVKSVNQAMISLEPVFQLLEKAVQWLADGVAKVVGWFTKLAGEGGETFKKIISGAAGVGNVLLQYLLAPIKTAVEAFKGLGQIIGDVFKGDFKKVKSDAQSIGKGIGDAFKKGFSVKANFEQGKALGEQFAASLGSAKPKKKAKDSGKEIGKEAALGVKEGFEEEVKATIKAIEDEVAADLARIDKEVADANKRANQRAKDRIGAMDEYARHQLAVNNTLDQSDEARAERSYQIQADANRRKLDLLNQFAQDALARGDLDASLDYEAQAAALGVQIEENALAEKKRIREQDKKDAEAKAKSQIQTMQSVASGISGILGTIADMYENDSEATAEQQKKAKAMRIAGATIDMLSGVVTAISTAMELGPIAGPIVGAINSAAVIAAGAANIAKMKAVTPSGGGSVTPTTMSAPVQAPDLGMSSAQSSSMQRQTNSEAINQPAQRVYILQSDIEASGNASRVRAQESSF